MIQLNFETFVHSLESDTVSRSLPGDGGLGNSHTAKHTKLDEFRR